MSADVLDLLGPPEARDPMLEAWLAVDRIADEVCGARGALKPWAPQPGPQKAFYECEAYETLYGGAAGGGKRNHVHTPIPTPSGWTTMGALRAGDLVLAGDGTPSRVLEAFPINVAERSYAVEFSDGEVILADAEHLWETTLDGVGTAVRTTAEIQATLRTSGGVSNHSVRAVERMGKPRRFVTNIRRTAPVPMRCIRIDHPSHLYLAGRTMIPTHNSSAAVALPLPWVHHSQLNVLILRRTTPQLEDLLLKAKGIYRDGVEGEYAGACPGPNGAEFRGDKNLWTFPSGARVRLSHCQYADDAFNYQGQEFQIIVFDELTHFEEGQYTEIASRIRAGVPGLPRRLCATTNPGGPGHHWVFKRWQWWLDPEATIPGREPRVDADGKTLPPADPGEVLWVLRRKPGGEEEVLLDPEEHRFGACITCGAAASVECTGERHYRLAAKSRTFIPARASDNPALMRTDPGYTARLLEKDPVRAAQLIDGNWLVKSGKGLYFRREWVEFVDAAAVPAHAKRCRGWDRAATEPSVNNTNPDWTRGVRLAYADGYWYIEDLVSLRAGPGPVDSLIRNTAELDGKGVRIRLPQDPGQAGKSQAVADIANLRGFTVTTKPVTGDKPTRFGPVSSQAHPRSTGGEKGRFRIVRGHWNEDLIRELEDLFDGDKDDIADALADAFDDLAPLARQAPAPKPPSPSAFLPGHQRLL